MEERRMGKLQEDIKQMRNKFSRGLSIEMEEEMRGIRAVLSKPTSQTSRPPRVPAAAAVAVEEVQQGPLTIASDFLRKMASYARCKWTLNHTCDAGCIILGAGCIILGAAAALGFAATAITIWNVVALMNEVGSCFTGLIREVGSMEIRWNRDINIKLIKFQGKDLIKEVLLSELSAYQQKQRMHLALLQFLNDYGSFFTFC